MYKWEYEVTNLSFNPTGSGLSAFAVEPAVDVPEKNNFFSPDNLWQFNNFQWNSPEKRVVWIRNPLQGPGLLPGETGEFGFVTLPRKVVVLPGIPNPVLSGTGNHGFSFFDGLSVCCRIFGDLAVPDVPAEVCDVPQGGRVVPERIASPISSPISCDKYSLGVKRVVWGSFGEADFLESDRGERLRLACEGAHVPYFRLTYQSGPGAEPVTVGACPWEGGCNTILFFHAGDNESPPSGKPDCLLSTWFLSRDYGRKNDEFAAYTKNPWTEERNLLENFLDWAVSSFDVNQRTLTKWDHKFGYAHFVTADLISRTLTPTLSCGVPLRPEKGGPMSTDQVFSTLVDPPIGPETEAFFDRVLDTLQTSPGPNEPMALSPFAVCDLDSDGGCGPADLGLLVAARGSCANQPDFHPIADVNADGCIDFEDQELLFPGRQIIQATLDIYPDDDLNVVNLRSRGVITVALLGSPTLDTAQVDPATAVFGRSAALEAHNRGHVADVNSDGRTDLILHFRTQETGIRCGDTRGILIAETFKGVLLEGADSVATIGCK
jgi:hypothetical protein